MDSSKLVMVINFLAGLCFIGSLMMGRNYVLIAIGGCLFVAGIVIGMKKGQGKSNDGDGEEE